MASSVDSIKYKCPICLKKLFPPVFQCTNGHLLCKNCIVKFEKCPTCNIPVVSDPRHGKIRNREVEKIIRDYQTHECPSPRCTKRTKLQGLAEHRPKCLYRTAKYCSFLKISNCHEKVSTIELANHLETKHQAKMYEIVQKFPESVHLKVRLQGNRDHPHIYMWWMQGQPTATAVDDAEGAERFLLILMVSLRGGTIFWTPFILGNDTLADRLKCEIYVFPNDKRARAVLACNWNNIYSPANKTWNLKQSFSATLEKLHSMVSPLTRAGTSESRNDDIEWDAYVEDEPDAEVEVEKESSKGNEEEHDNDDYEHDPSSDVYWVGIRLHDTEKNCTYNVRTCNTQVGGTGAQNSSPQKQTTAKQD